jgi:hypothetical protein
MRPGRLTRLAATCGAAALAGAVALACNGLLGIKVLDAEGSDAGSRPDVVEEAAPGDAAMEDAGNVADVGIDSGCVADLPCVPPANSCLHGTTSCDGGVSTCTPSTPVSDGTTCPDGVCCAGVCSCVTIGSTQCGGGGIET